MNKKIIKKYLLFFGLAIVLMLGIWTIWGNTALEINEFTITSNKLPNSFDGYRIVQVSDLHNAEFGNENTELIELVKNTNPDIISITGDLVDSRNTNIDIAIRFVEQVVEIAPVYYVTGNHEARLSDSEYGSLEQRLEELGVYVLHDEEILLEKEGEFISLLGIDDPSYCKNHDSGVASSMTGKAISQLVSQETYTILFSHRPEFLLQYCEEDAHYFNHRTACLCKF